MVFCIKRSLAIATLCLTCLLGLLVPSAYALDLSPAPEAATAYIISPSDSETVSSPFIVQFGLSGMGIAPAGIDRPNTGHHHLLIDVDELPSLTEPLQGSEQVLHYGAGQTETELSLTPGAHTLQLVLGNYSHIPHENPVISEKITVTVE
ncbi:rod shape-determining protein [Leptolyngbya sp. Heron Island J]|nr:rod shape-determining protein [Leptolyngbya sp. Heron Island J]